MKLVHESKYPGLNASQFRDLIADREYQTALAKYGKLELEDVVIQRTKNGAHTAWQAALHRTLDEPVGLRPLKAIFPHGFTAKWRETHTYKGAHGNMQLDLAQPARLCVSISGDETLSQHGDTLVRKIEVDMGRSKLPLVLRMIPGIRGVVAGEVGKGLKRADECTSKWLKDHPNRYTRPDASEVLNVSAGGRK